MSFGIICFRIHPEKKEIQYLMLRRKDSLGFVDFLRGKYNQYNDFHLNNIINEMTSKEKNDILNLSYNDLWCKLWNKKQLVYTRSVTIKSKNIKKIEFVKKKNNLYAITFLDKHIKMQFPNIDEEEIGMYNIYSCFDSEGIYRVSYAQRNVGLKNFNIIQKIKKFIDKNSSKD